MGPNDKALRGATAGGERQPLVSAVGGGTKGGAGASQHEQHHQGRRGVRRRRDGNGLVGLKAAGLLDEPLPERTVWAYAASHVMNDASAACWFSYLLIYLEKVRHLSSLHAGVVMFSGQVFDALATPIAGLLGDATPGWPEKGFGGHMVWYIVGSVLAFISFLGVFAFSPFARSDSPATVVYFSVMASTFNIGWAAVQVTNLSFIPELAKSDPERVRLVKLRYAATILANLSVFLLYLHGGADVGSGGTGARGVVKFQRIAATVLAVGSLCSLIFVLVVARHSAWAHAREYGFPTAGVGFDTPPPPASHPTDSSSSGGSSGSGGRRGVGGYESFGSGSGSAGGMEKGRQWREWSPEDLPSYEPLATLMPEGALHHQDSVMVPAVTRWVDWFRVRDFYLCALVYMASRIVVNISQVYLQFYLLDTLGLGDKELALVPLTLYLAGLGATFATEWLNDRLGRKLTYLAGCIVVLLACTGFHFLSPAYSSLVYPLAVILGAGSTTVMITSHSMANDLVGEHAAAKGGFVYGAFSLTDKLSNGMLILGIQSLKEGLCPAAAETAPDTVAPPMCSALIRSVLVWLPAVSVLLSAGVSCLVSSSPLLPPSFAVHSKAHVKKGSPTRLYRYSSFHDPCNEAFLYDAGQEGAWTDWVI